MKLFIALLSSLCAAAPKAEKEAPPAKTPAVLSVKSPATLKTGRDEDMKAATPGTRLVEQAELKTGPQGEIRLKLDGDRDLRLLSGTKISIPGIRWEGGEVPIVALREGTIRWMSTGPAGPRLQTPLFDLLPSKGDFIFSYDPVTARAELWVLEGEMSLAAMNAEDSVLVKGRQKAWFQGVIEDGEVAADLLLKGRKIPRGTLSKAVPLTADELKPFLEEEKIRDEANKKREDAIRRQAQTDLKEGVICLKPRGRLNDCSWVCEGNPKGAEKCRRDRAGVQCVRRRCNANGVWAEPKTLDLEEGRGRCEAKAIVGACDY